MKFLFLGTDNSKAFTRTHDILSKRNHSLTQLDATNDILALYKDLKDSIIATDAIIIDSSGLTDIGVFELAIALEADKPILLTHFKEDSVSKDISNSKSKRLYVKMYADKLDLEDVIDDFLQIVLDQLDAKLFMIIPPEVNRYLDWVASHTENSKSDIVRSAVIDVANNDSDYQDFLKNTK